MCATLFVLALGVGGFVQDWYAFVPQSKTFRVELPSRPTSTSNRSVNTAAGRSELTTAELKAADGTYSVQVTVNQGKVDPNTLDEGIRRFAESKKAVLGPVTPIVVGESQGREFEISVPGPGGPLKTKLRWVASENTLFMLSAAGKSGGELPPDAGRFLTSLVIGKEQVAAAARSNRPAPAVASAPTSPPPRSRPSGRSSVASTEGNPATGPAADVKDFDDSAEADARKLAKVPKPTDKSTARKGPQPKITISRLPKNTKTYTAEEVVDLQRSFLDTERDGFRDLGPAGSVLAGVTVSYIERFGGPKVSSVQPIYRLGTKYYPGRLYGQVNSQVATFVAKPGYAVGALVTHTGLTVDGFGIIYMKVDEDRLDPTDTYKSSWIGDRQGGGPGQVYSPGSLVVGLQGRAGKEVNALGLTTLKDAE